MLVLVSWWFDRFSLVKSVGILGLCSMNVFVLRFIGCLLICLVCNILLSLLVGLNKVMVVLLLIVCCSWYVEVNFEILFFII